MSMSNHSVKVVPDAQPQPKPKRVTPARSQVNPGVSESGNSAFDAVMSDVDSTPPTASSKGKSPDIPRRPPGVPGIFQVSQIWGPYPPRLPARGFTEDLKVMVIEDPDIVSLTKQLEEGAVPRYHHFAWLALEVFLSIFSAHSVSPSFPTYYTLFPRLP